MTTTDTPAPGIPKRQTGGAQRPHNAPMTSDARGTTNQQRLLEDGCWSCNTSQIACDAHTAMRGQRCCPMCAHP